MPWPRTEHAHFRCSGQSANQLGHTGESKQVFSTSWLQMFPPKLGSYPSSETEKQKAGELNFNRTDPNLLGRYSMNHITGKKLCFLKIHFYWFQREEGRRGETQKHQGWKRIIDWLIPAHPYWRSSLKPRHVPWLGIEPWPAGSWVDAQPLSHSSQEARSF